MKRSSIYIAQYHETINSRSIFDKKALKFIIHQMLHSIVLKVRKYFIYFPNGTYIDYLSLTYATNKNEIL